MSEFIRLQANGVDAYPDASTENTYRSNGTSVESALLALESNVNTLGGVAGEAKTLAEQNSVKIATAEQEISDINSSLDNLTLSTIKTFDKLITNMNDFVSRTSIAYFNSSTLNTPVSNTYGVCLCFGSNNVAWYCQICSLTVSGDVYSRNYSNGVWSEWVKLN